MGSFPAAVVIVFALTALTAGGEAGGQQPVAGEAGAGLLDLLGIEPSAESVDYVRTKAQFQLHTLLTEQRHPKTWPLGERVREDTLAGLKMLSSVDDDIRAKMAELAAAPEALERAARAVEEAVRAGRKIYVYGCGATGRLAKQMESAFWRPFWRRIKADRAIWRKLKGRVPERIEESLVGEMTGGDRALISSLEGFEDLQLIGRLQLRDRGVERGDVVICVTEGGETSSVIGTALAALDQWKSAPGYDPAESRESLYFVYNNPDDRLLPFERSRSVLAEPGITKINLTTGPQAVTGSTRMQATTIETYVVAAVVETAVRRALAPALGGRDMARDRKRTRLNSSNEEPTKARIALQRRMAQASMAGALHETVTSVARRDREPPDWAKGGLGRWGAEVHIMLKALGEPWPAGGEAHSGDAVSEEALVRMARDVLVAAERSPTDARELALHVGAIVRSEFWRRAMRAGKRLFEVPFTVRVDPGSPGYEELVPRLGSVPSAGEKVVVPVPGAPVFLSGAVDLAFLEEDGWVIADYKTDRFPDVLAGASDADRAKALGRLVELYAPQVRLYTRYWAGLSGEKIKESGLYFTALGKWVRVDPA